MNRKTVYKRQATVFKALGHPARIKIVEQLLEEELCVGEVERKLSIKQANVSQHLTILKNAGIVDCRQDGKRRCYFIIRPGTAFKLMECIRRRIE